MNKIKILSSIFLFGVIVLAIWFFIYQPPFLSPRHTTSFTIELVEETHDDIVLIESTEVETQAPKFYSMLEEASINGFSISKNLDVQNQIREYIKEKTNSPELGIALEYKNKIFELRVSSQ